VEKLKSNQENAELPIEIAAASAFSSERMELTLLPTEKCQFRCTYCYEDFSAGQMKREVIDGINRLIAKRAIDLESLYISWFGGEPLLACAIIEEIMEKAMINCSVNKTYLHGSMTTNGALLSIDVLKRLINLQVTHYQITLDGPRKMHDLTRLRANGSGSFDEIWNNLNAAKMSDVNFEIMVRLHITPQNKNCIVEFANTILDSFVHGDPRFSLFPMVVGNWGGPNTGSISVLSTSEGDSILCKIKNLIAKCNNTDHLSRTRETINVCYAAKPNAFVIRADGSVGKCTVALQNEENCIGKIRSNGTLELEQKKIHPWHKGWEDFDINNIGCPLGDVLSSQVVK